MKRLLCACALAAALLCGWAWAEEATESLPERLILVNKTHSLDQDYVPDDLVVPDVLFKDGIGETANQMSEPAARALERLFAAAKEDGITLVGMSGYRSYWTQAWIYETRLKEAGLEHVSKYNAQPGQSEHQTGLAMDVSSPDCMVLETWFDQTDAFAWLSEHCADFGFIIRYRKGLEEETGYAYEPWHLRYVGERAREIMDSGVSLEAYLSVRRPAPQKERALDPDGPQPVCVQSIQVPQ